MDRYFHLSRTHTYSLLFAVPLLVLYEAGAAYLAQAGGPALRNGADVMLRTLLAAGGVQGTLAFTGVLLGAALLVVVLERRRRRVPLRAGVFGAMMLESVVYALLLGVVVGTATQWVLEGMRLRLAVGSAGVGELPLLHAVVLSLGAGIYEELVFRVLLVGGLAGAFLASGLPRTRAGGFAALLAALAFSAFHYIGPYGDPWEIPSFLFRFLAGLVFSVLFLLRGFGIAAWTHALYDVFLFVGRGW
ncbi:MAG: CPBP family intramembrane metalloprotease [Gemmatimonadetes bacterium]|nr:CPBP family intramembrane metalloprotease [Gemmatimonadota bacterium]